MRELPQKQVPGILSAPMQRMKMHGLDDANSSAAKSKAARKKKRVAENITEDYLNRRLSKQINEEIANGAPEDGTMSRKSENTLDWIDRLVRKRLLTKKF